MKNEYLLAVLDPIVTELLDPENIEIRKATAESLDTLDKRIEQEIINFKRSFHNMLFSLREETAYYFQIELYISSIKYLQDRCVKNLGELSFSENYQRLKLTYKKTIGQLEKFLFFIQERFYPLEVPREKINSELTKSKLLCNVSADQIAIFLNAAYSSGVIEAKSKTQIFKQIVPYLSTQHRDTLSWSSMRSRAYEQEQTDIRITIQVLEGIIKTIKES